MATLFQLAIGSTVIDLNGAGNTLAEYSPRPGDGIKPVTESAVVYMVASTVDNLLAAINAIQSAGTGAVRRQLIGAGDRVFVKFRPDGATTTYRSEVLRIEAGLSDDSLWGLPTGVANKRVKVTIAFTRVGYREDDTLTALPLTNGNGSGLTTGINVYNANDGDGSSPNKRHNYVEIAAADIGGVLPTPAYIEITNSFGSTARRFYIGHKAQGTPASFTHVLEAENATGASATGDGDCSGANKVAVANVPATVTTLFTWAITNTQASYILSQWLRFLLRFEDKPNNNTCQVRLLLQDSTTTAVIGQTDWVTLNNADELQPIGTLQLSPNMQGQSSLGALKLVLQGKDSAATCDFGLDFLSMMPIELGSGFRFLKPIDEALVTVPATTGVLVDNGVDDAEPFVEGRQDVYAGYGGRIMLVPGVINRLYFHHDGASGDGAVERVLSVVVKYRKRVVTI